MLKDLSRLSNETMIESLEQDSIPIKNISRKDVAIIGISCRFSKANNAEEYWKLLMNGEDGIRDLPKQRKRNNEAYLENIGMLKERIEYYQGGFLTEIDTFDYDFFGISPTEASLMSPNQRLFLETTWDAIEDAGYGGSKLQGTKTGIYIGHSTDFGIGYREFIKILNPELAGVSIPGNINSIIAGRISYLLDLKGPSVAVDTACSSSLAAVHYACRDLRNGECDLAIAGGIKIDLLPLECIKKEEDELGITSADGRARTFDDASDGTGLGEGVGVILIKPLSKALDDGDHIYAVIKGSAINQDGASVGLTAPNSAAQADLLTKAWQDARIDPETISLVEAHGTGTKLGDPVEIRGLQNAFNNYTQKKQFCAVGSVKTNIGHLDHAAGIAGLIKIVLALKHKTIPPSIHFTKPNRNINFTESPLYVNDRLQYWENNGTPRRAGVSAFGLSGTNCHLVLEEASQPIEEKFTKSDSTKFFLTLSAKNKAVLLNLVKVYRDFLGQQSGCNLNSLCYTANTGRSQYSCRLAIKFMDAADLTHKLEEILINELNISSMPDIYYGENHLVTVNNENNRAGAETGEYPSANSSGNDAFLDELCRLYINGADLDWEEFYRGKRFSKISLPGYPFSKQKCWLKDADSQRSIHFGQSKHPLLERILAESFDRLTYLTEFRVDKYWVLNEHLVNGKCVLPGTAYLEMVIEIIKRHYSGHLVHFKDILFIAPLIVNPGETVPVQLIIQNETDYLEFVVASDAKASQSWVKHAEGRVLLKEKFEFPKYDLQTIKEQCSGGEPLKYSHQVNDPVQTGPRWNAVQTILSGQDKYLALLKIAPEFTSDLKTYHLHPALMDEAVNILMKSCGEGLYLPFSYRNLKVYDKMPGKFYSHILTKKMENEIATFDVILMDESGKVFAEAEAYSIKKVTDNHPSSTLENDPCYKLAWNKQELDNPEKLDHECVLVFKGQGERSEKLVKRLRQERKEIIEVVFGAHYQKINEDQFSITGSEADFKKLLSEVKSKPFSQILHLFAVNQEIVYDVPSLETQLGKGLYSLFYLTKGILASRIKNKIDLVLIADYANEINLTEIKIHPHHAAFFGFGKVIGEEYSQLQCRCIDVDDDTDLETILAEIESKPMVYQVAYRQGERYIPELTAMNYNTVISDLPVKIEDHGVYIITGGTGGIGLEISKYLASKNKVNLALINRSPLPARETWDEILENGSDAKLIRKLATILEIEAGGSSLSFFNADVSNLGEMKQIVDELRSHYGRINGIIHCAGVAGDGFIILKNEAQFNQVIAPKIYGTYLLDKLTQGDELDFMILFSSVTALSAGVGQSDYTAANCYLDSYAAYRNKSGRRTIAINWPAWEEVGMAVNYGVDQVEDLFDAINPKEAIREFEQALNTCLTNVIIGKLNEPFASSRRDKLHFKIAAEVIHPKTTNPKMIYSSNKDVSDLINTPNRGAQLTGTTEQVAQIWAKVLGISEIGIHDNFNNLGGNSIMATLLLKEMDRCFPGKLDIVDIFTHNTIDEMARHLEKTMVSSTMKSMIPEDESDDLDQLLEKLANGEFTEAEIDKLA